MKSIARRDCKKGDFLTSGTKHIDFVAVEGEEQAWHLGMGTPQTLGEMRERKTLTFLSL